MGLTSGAWTDKTVNGRLVLECDLTQASVQTEDSFTLKVPAHLLDPTKPWILYVNTKTAITTDTDGDVPVDLWGGWDDAFALTSAAPPTATYGAEIASAIMDSVQAETLVARIDPNYTGTVVQAVTGTAGHVNAGTPPYFVINLDAGTTMDSGTCHIAISQ